MKLYIGHISAAREETARNLIHITHVRALADADEDIDAEMDRYAQRLYPDADGWADRQISTEEFRQGEMFGGYRITWQAERIADPYHMPDRTMEAAQ
jgi:hypothetical protein